MLWFWIACTLACLGGLYGLARCNGWRNGFHSWLGCNSGWRLYAEIFLWTQFTGLPLTYALLSLLRLKCAS